MSAIKRLFWDIETAPCIGFFWGPGYKLSIPHENIIKERKIICIGYKWEGEKKRTVLRWDENQDDKAMLEKFLLVANEADELVAHYGNHFDIPWFRTRCLFHGFPPIPIYKTVDTKTLASKYFYFNSNKLDYIADFLGYGKKYHTDFDLWIKIVLNKDQKALDYMCRYCGRDLDLLEKVYSRISGFVRPQSHAGVMAGLEKWTCPHCGSENVAHNKRRVTARGTVQHQFLCKECHGYYSVSEKANSDYQKRPKK